LLLFPYANDVEYIDQTLSFNIQIISDNKTVEIAIKMQLDEDLSEKIEELLEMV
jgi:hypothetical protein